MILVPKKDWNQIVIADPFFLSGNSVKALLSFVVAEQMIEWIVAADVEGDVASLAGMIGLSMRPTSILHAIESSTQIDWAFFYLYLKRPDFTLRSQSDLVAAVAAAKTTVRLADDTHFYIYTQSDDLAVRLKHKYPGAEIKNAAFQQLEIPF